MDLATRLAYFRKEHLDILRFLDKWEGAVSLIISKDDERRTKALSELREMESELQAIRNHCHSEERNLQAPYRSYLKQEQLSSIPWRTSIKTRETRSKHPGRAPVCHDRPD